MKSEFICDNNVLCNNPAVQYAMFINGDPQINGFIAACEHHKITNTSKLWKTLSKEEYIVAKIMLK